MVEYEIIEQAKIANGMFVCRKLRLPIAHQMFDDRDFGEQPEQCPLHVFHLSLLSG